VTHLRIVRPREPKRRKGDPRVMLLSAEEERRARQALRNLKDAYRTWKGLADAMRVAERTLRRAMTGRYPIPVSVLFCAMRASGMTIADLLSAPGPVTLCHACGQIKRRVA
jgi:hypothetical protein